MRAIGWMSAALALVWGCGRTAAIALSDGGSASTGSPDAGPPTQHALHLRVIGNGEARATGFSCRSARR